MPRRRFRDMPLKTQAHIAVLAFGVLGIIFASLILMALVTPWELNELDRDLTINAQLVANETDRFLEDIIRQMNYLGRLRGIIQLPSDQQFGALDALLRHNSSFQTVAFADKTGQITQFAHAVAGYALEPKMLGRALEVVRDDECDYVGPLEWDAKNKCPMIVLAVPVRDMQDSVHGLLWAKVDLRPLGFLLADARLGKTGYVFLEDNRGVVVATHNGFLPVGETPPSPLSTPGRAWLRSSLMRGLQGETSLYAVAPVNTVDWRLVAALPLTSAFSPLFRLAGVMAFALSCLLGLAIVSSRIFARRLVTPLASLQEAVASFGEGHLDTRASEDRGDELGGLARTFNAMASHLRAANFNLSTEVAERRRVEEALRAGENAARQFGEMLENLVAISNELTSAESQNQLCRLAVEMGRSRLGFERMSIWLMDAEPGFLRGVYGTNEMGETRDECDMRWFHADDENLYELLGGSRAVEVTRDTESRSIDGRAPHHADHAFAGLWDGATMLGLLTCDTYLTGAAIEPDQEKLLAIYAATLGHLLRRKEAEEDLREITLSERSFSDALTRLHEVTSMLSGCHSADDLCRSAVEQGRARLGFDRMSIWLYDPVMGTIRGTYGTDEEGLLRDERSVIRSLNEWDYLPLLSGDPPFLVTEEAQLRNAKREPVGKGAQCVVGLWDGVKVAGVLSADTLLSHTRFTSHQITLLRLYASALGHLLKLKTAEQALRSNETRLRGIFDTAPVSIWEEDIEGVVQAVNELEMDSPDNLQAYLLEHPDVIAAIMKRVRVLEVNTTSLTLYEAADTAELRSNLAATMVDTPMSMVAEAITALTLGAGACEAETPFQTLKGNTRSGVTRMVAMDSESGRRVIVCVTDLTELKRARDEAKRLEGEFRMLVENLNEGFIITNASGELTYANECAADLVGISRDQLTGLHAGAIGGGDVELLAEADGLCREGAAAAYEVNWVRHDGRHVATLVSANPLWDLDGGYNGSFAVLTDITQVKILEERARRAEKMEALGQLAGGVAHDLNNILSGLVSYPDLLLAELPPDSRLRVPLQTIKRSGERAAGIVEDLLALTRRGVAQPQRVNLNRVIEDFWESPEGGVLRERHPKVRIIFQPGANLPTVDGSPVHLLKIVMNLAANACEAMADGGELEIRTERRPLAGALPGYDRVVHGEYAWLRIADTGMGIAQDDLSHIFEPFYTRKTMGRSGTGLGLTVVWGAVEDHKGYITVTSQPGKGTAFEIYLPVSRGAAITISEPASLASLRGNGETILVVDDLPEQRDIASRVLHALGYTPACSASGEEAITWLRNADASLLLLDMIMPPGMDGLETYEHITAFRPGQKAVLCSGYAETDRVKEARRLGASGYIKKPYGMRELAVAIKTALEDNGTTSQ